MIRAHSFGKDNLEKSRHAVLPKRMKSRSFSLSRRSSYYDTSLGFGMRTLDGLLLSVADLQASHARLDQISKDKSVSTGRSHGNAVFSHTRYFFRKEKEREETIQLVKPVRPTTTSGKVRAAE